MQITIETNFNVSGGAEASHIVISGIIIYGQRLIPNPKKHNIKILIALMNGK